MNFIAEPYGASVIQTPPEPMQYPRLNPLAPEFHVAEIRQGTEPVGRPKQGTSPKWSTRIFLVLKRVARKVNEYMYIPRSKSVLRER